MTRQMTQEFVFDLVFAFPSTDVDRDIITDALFEPGCDDVVVGFGAPGSVGLAFTRTGGDAAAVITEAEGIALFPLPDGAKLRQVLLERT